MSLEPLHRLLKAASLLLAEAGVAIHERGLQPQKELVRHVGNAMAHIVNIQDAIYAVQPELEPPQLQESRLDPRAAREYGERIIRAHELYERGDRANAIALWEEYVQSEPPEFFRELALEQLRFVRKDESHGGA